MQLSRAALPDLVLMDIRMPKCDGLAAAERIIALDIPLVFITAYSQLAYVEAAKRIGAYGYLVKPIPEGELTAMAEVAMSTAWRVRRLSEELASVSQRERDRREVERARDLLAHVENVSQEIAYARLRSESMRLRTPLVQIARRTIQRLGARTNERK